MTTYTVAPYERQLFTANGSATGLITVTSTANLVEGAVAFLSSSAVSSVKVYIQKIVNGTTLYCKQLGTGDYTYYNPSALLLVDSAVLVQPGDMAYSGINVDN